VLQQEILLELFVLAASFGGIVHELSEYFLLLFGGLVILLLEE
jgi:hypothetical protein